jgi:hypothetical protein
MNRGTNERLADAETILMKIESCVEILAIFKRHEVHIFSK